MTFLNARAIIQMHFFISELTERSPGTQERILIRTNLYKIVQMKSGILGNKMIMSLKIEGSPGDARPALLRRPWNRFMFRLGSPEYLCSS